VSLQYWLFLCVLIGVAVAFLPIGFGIAFRYANGEGELRVIVVIAHLLHWRVIVPTRLFKKGKRGLKVAARTGFTPEGERTVNETITPQKMLEEAKVPESQLHMLLTGIDLLQVVVGGKNTSDNRGRSLGSPLMHLVFGPIMVFVHNLCKVEFFWQSKIGTGDAVSTALGAGFLWTLKSGLGALLEKRFIVLRPPEVSVIPDFDNVAYVTDIHCIFHLSIGQIMWRAARDAAQRWQGKGAGAYGG
jgi:hypothetical protein